MSIVLIYLLIMNVVNYYMMGYDKRQARMGKRRIPEKRFFICAAIGGALGGLMGMRKWRHKTQHTSFVVGFRLLLGVNLFCMYFIMDTLKKW